MAASDTLQEGVNKNIVRKENQTKTFLIYVTGISFLMLGLGFAGGYITGASAEQVEHQDLILVD
jgi:hypothetical protein